MILGPLTLYREDMSPKEKHQADEPETERVRIYEVVNYIIHLFDFKLLWNTSKKLHREDMFLREKHQAGEPETESLRIYEFVNYIIDFVDIALFWNTLKTI